MARNQGPNSASGDSQPAPVTSLDRSEVNESEDQKRRERLDISSPSRLTISKPVFTLKLRASRAKASLKPAQGQDSSHRKEIQTLKGGINPFALNRMLLATSLSLRLRSTSHSILSLLERTNVVIGSSSTQISLRYLRAAFRPTPLASAPFSSHRQAKASTNEMSAAAAPTGSQQLQQQPQQPKEEGAPSSTAEQSMTATTGTTTGQQSNSEGKGKGEGGDKPPLVMQLILDGGLVKDPNWGAGPLIAQGAHAAIAVIATTQSTSSATQAYIAPSSLASMHKVVLTTPPNLSLRELARRLDAGREAELEARRKRAEEAKEMPEGTEEEETFPRYHLWIEQPEDIPTCIAIEPNRKPAALKKILNKCKLFRG